MWREREKERRLNLVQPKINTFYIQAARGAAVLLVMLFHASMVGLRYFNIDYLGISGMGQSGAYTFFFVLTGYLMYTLYNRHFGNEQAAWPFLLKRFGRIFPVYWLVNAAIIPLYFLVPSFGFGYERQLPVIVKSLLLFPQSHAPILGVAWSLSYIVFFYIMFSFLFLSKGKLVASVYSSWLTIIVLKSIGLINVKNGVLEQFLFSELHLQFFVGVLVAYVAKKRSLPGRGIWWILASCVIYAVLWAARTQIQNLPHVELLHTIGSGVLLIGIVTLKGQGSRLLKPLIACGNASYSILLLSLPAMSITFKLARILKLDQWIGAFATVTLCAVGGLLLCLLFYRWIERPYNEYMRRSIQTKALGVNDYPAPAEPAR
jgi:peptidoglycan/LPS O-acetylase OafA/YrhL